MIFFVILILTQMAAASDVLLVEESSEPFQFGLRAETVFPIFIGPGIFIKLNDSMEFSASYGFTPEPYYTTIGSVAASMGSNSSYADVIRAAFQNNSILKVAGHFTPNSSNWSFGIGSYVLAASGNANIDTVLAASTGRDYTGLKNALTALGRPTQVQLKSNLVIFEVFAKHKWNFEHRGDLTAGLGVAKVMSAKVDVQTGLTVFESTVIGQNLISQSETDLQSIIEDNGISPTISVAYDYFF